MDNNGGFLDSYFGIKENNTSVRAEILAGITTFVTLAYILIVNPQILSAPYEIMGDAAMAQKIYNGVFIGTCLGSFIGTFLCAMYAKMPFAQATGMGLNAFFAYTVVLTMGYTYNQALVIVFISGLFFIAITAIGLREAIVSAIPDCVKDAITPGIGLFIAMIGLQTAGIIVNNDATLIGMIDFSIWRIPDADTAMLMNAIVALVGLFVMAILSARNIKGSILIGIIVATIIGIPLGVTKSGDFSFNLGQQMSDFFEVSFMSLDFRGLISSENLLSDLFTVIMLVISFSLVNMFDSIGTLLGAAKSSGLTTKDGTPKNMYQLLMSDAISTAAGALVGTSTVTTMVESSAGITAGGRTGLTSLTTAILLILSIVLAPIVTLIPGAATAPALIMVGVAMLGGVKDVDFSDMTNSLPAFLTMAMMPFTYSIANGIAFGLISYCILKIFTGKFKDLSWITIGVAVVFIARYAFMTA